MKVEKFFNTDELPELAFEEWRYIYLNNDNKNLYNVKNPDIMQQLYDYFYDNHDVMLVDSDFNEINRIINK